MAIIGIDLGTTNSIVTVWKNGQVQLIPNSFGEYLTPSIVSFDENGEVYVGKVAKEMLITNPDRTFKEFKREMGTDKEFVVGNKSYRAEELSALVLKKLKEDAENYLGEEIEEAVISVPAYFDDNRRTATKNAGKIAGLKVERIINEPSAVALKNHDLEEDEVFIVFDFGGGTLDVSVVEAFENVVEILAVAGDNMLGGKDFNEVIAKDFYETNRIEVGTLTEEERGRVIKEAELLKMELTNNNSASRKVLIAGMEYVMSMTNQKLIKIARELFIRMSQPLRKAINDSGFAMEDIDKIILVGGTSKMPIVAKYIESIVDIDVIVDKDPDESIAMGVGIAAAIKERHGDIKDMVLSDICPFSLGVNLYDGTFSPIIVRNEVLPCSITRMYTTVRDDQEEVKFKILQGDNLKAKDNTTLGEMTIRDLPKAPAGSIPIIVRFTYDINGILDVEIDATNNNKVHKLIVNKNAGLTEEEVKEKIAEIKGISLYSKDNEVTKYLTEKAERLYRESDINTREYIVEVLKQFRERMAKAINHKSMRNEQVSFSIILNKLEQNIFQFADFDESFWEEDSDDDK